MTKEDRKPGRGHSKKFSEGNQSRRVQTRSTRGASEGNAFSVGAAKNQTKKNPKKESIRENQHSRKPAKQISLPNKGQESLGIGRKRNGRQKEISLKPRSISKNTENRYKQYSGLRIETKGSSIIKKLKHSLKANKIESVQEDLEIETKKVEPPKARASKMRANDNFESKVSQGESKETKNLAAKPAPTKKESKAGKDVTRLYDSVTQNRLDDLEEFVNPKGASKRQKEQRDAHLEKRKQDQASKKRDKKTKKKPVNGNLMVEEICDGNTVDPQNVAQQNDSNGKRSQQGAGGDEVVLVDE